MLLIISCVLFLVVFYIILYFLHFFVLASCGPFSAKVVEVNPGLGPGSLEKNPMLTHAKLEYNFQQIIAKILLKSARPKGQKPPEGKNPTINRERYVF